MNLFLFTAILLLTFMTLMFVIALLLKDNSVVDIAYGSAFVLIVGVLLGTFLANTLGEALAGAVIASIGASSFNFVVNPLSAYVLSPLLMMGVVLAATYAGTLDAGQIQISENIKE